LNICPALKAHLKISLFVAVLSTIFMGAWQGQAFSLLGPFQPWMQVTNDLRQSGDIGGPMCISNAYRWDVPVVTYGFDQSFIKFFGMNGEAAVQSAIQVINDLPPASDIISTNYPSYSTQIYGASAENLLDLKSWTLSLLLEQMGLAQPTRYIFVLRQWNPVFIEDDDSSQWPDWAFPNYISERNYDPLALTNSQSVNGILYFGDIGSYQNYNYVDTEPEDNEFGGNFYTAVADQELEAGAFFTTLTSDDVGGLKYLFSTNNVTYENLLPGVSGMGTNLFVNGAWRPGINKISFVPQPVNSSSGAFLPQTNFFTDAYLSNGISMQQQLMRVVVQPDILFSAADVTSSVPGYIYFSRTGTTNWQNNAAANGSANGAGPGVIRPPIQIVLNKLGQDYLTLGAFSATQAVSELPYLWASFDATTNAPVVYPVPQTGTNQMTVRMWLWPTPDNFASFSWKPTSLTGAQFALQTSTDLASWTTLFAVTNDSSSINYINYIPMSGNQFYRLVPQ
jgi:hypothetical protein